jgi:CRISPR-associated protein Csh2
MSEQLSLTELLPVEKSEILFFYETSYSTPNGDPFTGEQRYDEETKKILVSDVRIKRFIRDEMERLGYNIYVSNPDPENKLNAGQRFMKLFGERKDKNQSAREFAFSLFDVRLFGAVIPIQKEKGKKKNEGGESSDGSEKENAFNITGAIQFSVLNPSLNSVDLRMHQNTSTFVSKEGNKQGAIGTTTVVPYALNQIHGWINPYSAKHTGLTEADVTHMFQALWNSINNANTRTKQNQNSLLLLQIIYSEPNKKLYGADRLIKLNPSKATEEQIRSSEDYTLDFDKLHDAAQNEIVKEIRFFTEVEAIAEKLQGDKFKAITL